MDALIRFAENHPWWTLVYLNIIASFWHGLVRINLKRKT